MKIEIELPKENALDKAIKYVAPRAAARRMRSRLQLALLGGYSGARFDKNSTRQFYPGIQSADADTIYDLPTLRARSRDMVRNTPVATGAVNTMLTNVVGSGLTLMSRPDGKTLNWTDEETSQWAEQVEREFRLWAETTACDVCATQNFYQLQGLIFRSVLESGDSFALLPMVDPKNSLQQPYGLRVQVIEADRIDSPLGTGITQSFTATGSPGVAEGNRVAGGVEQDKFGKPVAYHVMSHHPGDVAFAERTWTRVPAFAPNGRRNCLHVYDKLRPGQSRGVPFLAPVIEPLKQLDRYTEAELMAAVVGAMFTVFVTTDTGDGFSPDTGQAASGSSTLQSTGGADASTKPLDPKYEIGLGNGAVANLAPGENVEFADPKRPSTSFDPFVEAILRQVGVALGLPFEVLIKHFTASYSAARAALLEAWRVFKLRRDFLSTAFCAPVYEAWMEEAVAMQRISAPGFFVDPAMRRAYLQADWVGDAPGQIDPMKEVQAAQARVNMGVSSLQRETLALTGSLWSDVNAEQVREKEIREKNGLQLPLAAAAAPAPGAPGVAAGTDPANNGSDLENEAPPPPAKKGKT